MLISLHKSLPMACINVHEQMSYYSDSYISTLTLHLALVTGAKHTPRPSLTLSYSRLIAMKPDHSSDDIVYEQMYTNIYCGDTNAVISRI